MEVCTIYSVAHLPRKSGAIFFPTIQVWDEERPMFDRTVFLKRCSSLLLFFRIIHFLEKIEKYCLHIICGVKCKLCFVRWIVVILNKRENLGKLKVKHTLFFAFFLEKIHIHTLMTELRVITIMYMTSRSVRSLLLNYIITCYVKKIQVNNGCDKRKTSSIEYNFLISSEFQIAVFSFI